MLELNLKSLYLQSKSEKGSQHMHKRIQLGRLSFLIYYQLHDGILTIDRARPVRSRYKSSKGCKRSRGGAARASECGSSQTYMIVTTDCNVAPPMVHSVATQSEEWKRPLQIDKSQQTIMKSFNFCGRFPNVAKVGQATQTPEQKVKVLVGVAQTEKEEERNISLATEVEEKIQLTPQDQILCEILNAINSQEQLLLTSLESIQMMTTVMCLECQRKRTQDQFQLQKLYARSTRLCGKYRCRLLMHKKLKRRKRKSVSGQSTDRTQTQLTPTVCNWTQTEALASEEGATQSKSNKARRLLRLQWKMK